MTLYRGDDTDAFNCRFLNINLKNAEGLKISKAIFICGEISKVYENPVFPLDICFSCKETKKLKPLNNCYLILYDEFGRQKTCESCFTFYTKKGVV